MKDKITNSLTPTLTKTYIVFNISFSTTDPYEKWIMPFFLLIFCQNL